MVAIIDTHRLITHLTSQGFSAAQAEGIVETITEIDRSHLATKADLQDEIRKLEIRMLKFLIPIIIGRGNG